MIILLIKWPNCNRDTFNDYKCQYCKYVLKTNNYEKDISENLKADYINSKNKAITIKNGINKFNKSFSLNTFLIFVIDYNKNLYHFVYLQK